MFELKIFRRQKNICGLVMAIPAIISVAVLIVYPLIFSTALSFTSIRANIVGIKWNDFNNYRWLFSEDSAEFWNGMYVAFKFSFVSTVIQTLLGYFLAYLLYNMTKKMQTVYRVLLYIPCILPGTVVSIMWKFIYQYDVGLLFRISEALNVTPVKWLTDPNVVLWSIIIANTWRFVGMTMVLYIVNMNAVPKEILEGAIVDGASRWTILWKFIFPLTIGATKMNIILSFVGGMKTFDLFFFLTGGSVREANTAGWVIYRSAFKDARMGWAIVMSVALTIILSLFTVISNKLMNRVEESYVD